jgi:hypothetical protein
MLLSEPTPFDCRLAVAVLVPVPPVPVSAWSAGTIVVLVTVSWAPFAPVVVKITCCVTDWLVVNDDDSELELRAEEVEPSEVLDACPKGENCIELEKEV